MAREALILYIDSGSKEQLRELAARADRSLSAFARLILEKEAARLAAKR